MRAWLRWLKYKILSSRPSTAKNEKKKQKFLALKFFFKVLNTLQQIYGNG
jgi:hypothetical protein